MSITLSRMVKAAERECALREAVYPGRVQAGKMPEEQASTEIAAMQGILRSMQWFERNEKDIKLAMACLKLLRAHPGGFEWLLNDDAVNAVLKTFPEAQVVAIRSLDKHAA